MKKLQDAIKSVKKNEGVSERQIRELRTMVDGEGMQSVLEALHDICVSNAEGTGLVTGREEWKKGAGLLNQTAMDWQKSFPNDIWLM